MEITTLVKYAFIIKYHRLKGWNEIKNMWFSYKFSLDMFGDASYSFTYLETNINNSLEYTVRVHRIKGPDVKDYFDMYKDTFGFKWSYDYKEETCVFRRMVIVDERFKCVRLL